MSQENVEIIRKAFETRSLQETAERYWHPDIEFIEDPLWPGASSYHGREAVLRCWRGYTAVLGSEQDALTTVERVHDAGDRLVAIVRFQGPGSASGVPFEQVWAYVVEVRERRIAYLRACYEPAATLEAVGLRE